MVSVERLPPVTKALSERIGAWTWSGGNMKAIAYYVQMVASMSIRAQHKQLATLASPLLARCESNSTPKKYDLVVVGGGIVGMATAREIALRHPKMNIAVLEKENHLAPHQTGHNSGVIHMGIYYKPGSLKAKLCVKGAAMLYDYLDKKSIPYKKCGKVIVAVDDSEVARLRDLFERAQVNNVPGVKMIDANELKKIEPHCQGVMAIHSPNTGIVDFAKVTRSYAEDFKKSGGQVFINSEVNGFELVQKEGEDAGLIQVKLKDKDSLVARQVITCCGLQSDRVAKMSGCSSEPRVVPFRGEYLILHHSKAHLVNGNIYPVPDPRFPFLGVHFTPRMDGAIWLGPNAVLAFAREGYNFSDFSWTDFKEMMGFKGLRKLAGRYWRFGSGEMYRRFVLRASLKKLQRYIPEITLADISRGPAGIRAQAMDNDGSLVEDFVFDQGEGELGKHMLHVRNAPSPAATSSLAIGDMIADKAHEIFHWTTNNTKK